MDKSNTDVISIDLGVDEAYWLLDRINEWIDSTARVPGESTKTAEDVGARLVDELGEMWEAGEVWIEDNEVLGVSDYDNERIDGDESDPDEKITYDPAFTIWAIEEWA